MKKFLSLLTTTILVLSLAACSGGGSSSTAASEGSADSTAPAASESTTAESTEPEAAGEAGGDLAGKTITFTMQKYGSDPAAQQKALEEMTAYFKEKTGITVEFSIIDWGQALTKLTLACTGGEAPDVADAFFTSSIVQMGQGQFGPMDITDIYEELGGDEAYFEAAVEEVRIDGKIYGIPWRMDTRCLVYNTEHFEAAGIEAPPKTYDELIEIAKKLTVYDDAGNIDRSGMVWQISDSRFDQTWFALIAGHGGSLMDENYEKMAFNSAEGADSLALMRDMITVHKVCTPNVIDPSFKADAEFMAEKTSIVAGVNADFKTTIVAQAPQLEGKFASAVMPNKTGEGVSSIAFSAPIVIMNNTDELEASREWVKYFCSTEGQLKICTAVNLINSRKEVMADAAYSDPWMATYPQQAERAVQGDPPIPVWSQIDAFPNGPLNTMCTKVIAGEDIQAAMDACDVECEKILAEMA